MTVKVEVIYLAITGGIGGLVLLITNIAKLKDYGRAYNQWRHKRFAVKQHPYCSDVCQAPKYMIEISSTLKNLQEEMSITRKISLKTLGDRIKQKSEFFQAKGYMPQADKDEIICDFLTYDLGGGNGTVEYKVGICVNLPIVEGGKPCELDLSAIKMREREKHNFN